VEVKVYRKRAVIVCVVEVLAAVALLGLNLHSAAVGVTWCLVAVSVMMVVAKLVARRRRQLDVQKIS
jgi:ACR3 family arsenite efflux pump ArsB